MKKEGRSDYELKLEEVPNGLRRPTEVYEFSMSMRRWRERGWDSEIVFY